MTTPYYSYDGDNLQGIAPHRPGTEHVGFDDLENLASKPPDPRTEPTAEAWNERSRVLSGLSRVSSTLKLSVTFSGGDPAVASFAQPGTNLIIGDFVPTDNGVGDTTITWPANRLPPSICKSMAYLNGIAPGMIASEPVSNGVRVVTLDNAGAPADLPFTVEVG